MNMHTRNKDLDSAKQELKYIAQRVGCNAVLNITYSKDTESSGNYRYSVHNFQAEGVILVKEMHTTDKKLAEQKDRDLYSLIETVDNNRLAYLEEKKAERRAKAFRIAGIIIVLVAAFIGTQIINYMRQ